MFKQVEVNLDFVNKKKEEKHVKFYMDKKTYEILFDESISEEIRHQYLVDEYHAYERERYYRRKFVSFDSEMAQSLNLIEDTSISSKDRYENEVRYNNLKAAINMLSFRQKEIITKVYFENMKQIEVSKALDVSKEFVSKTLSKAIANLKKILNN